MIGAKAKLVSFTFRDRTVAVFERSLPMLELLAFSDTASGNSGKECRPVGNVLADSILHSGIRGELLRASPFATSGLIAYERAGAPLGADIISEDHSGVRIIFPTGRFRGERSIALFVLSASRSDLEADRSGREIFVSLDQSRVIPVPAFPDSSGWHGTIGETGIPHGEPVPDGEGRFLSRTVNPYVGLVARGYSHDGHGKAHVCADFAPWYHLGAVFEVK